MRILLLGHRDIASNIALSLIVAGLPGHRFDVMLSGHIAARDETPQQLVALSVFERELCDELTAIESARRNGILSFEELAARNGGTAGTLAQPNSTAGLQVLRDRSPDLFISVRYRRILKDDAIAVPRLGVLNLHSGLLPDYRGMMATFWAMLNGESTIGSTLHYILDACIDTGPIVARAPMPADRRRSYLASVLDLYRPACKMVIDAVRRIDRGQSVACAAQENAGTYYSMPGSEDLERFERAGLRLFDGDELRAFLESHSPYTVRTR